ncbi:MAG: class I SAM-dependent methyltransferase [Bdellovibrionaceae bacterium]|nr:class I SAM-dependent methyltransferase [Pseudobdellovibrionaceae bacterium]MDW8190180.1 class I SAM-dependent methyltransferase [Pseudobdellovibrionaceae bacterium]
MSPPPITPSLVTYYSNNDEHLRHQRHQLEFDVTIKYLTKLTQTNSGSLKILEVGAGAGYYTKWLLQKGHEVTAVEPVPRLVQQLEHLKETWGTQLTVIQGDETAIYQLTAQFDRILLMGPLYHLFDKDQRKTLLIKSHQMLSKEGQVFAIFLSRIGYLSYLLKNDPGFVHNKLKEFQEMLFQGYEKQPTLEGVFHGNFDKLETILDLYKQVPAQIQFVAALDPIIGPFDELYNQLPEPLKQSWLEIAYHTSLWPEALGSARTWALCSRPS